MCHLNDLQCLELEQVTSIVLQHSVEVSGTAAAFAAADFAAELYTVVWETVAAEL